MSDLRYFSSDFLVEFIKLYKSHTCLWKVKSKEYSDKFKKQLAYDELIEKLKEVEIDVTKDKVMKRISSLRSVYRRERKKVINSQKTATGPEDIYVTSLWYYNHMTFLDEPEKPCNSVSKFEDALKCVKGSAPKDEPLLFLPPADHQEMPCNSISNFEALIPSSPSSSFIDFVSASDNDDDNNDLTLSQKQRLLLKRKKYQDQVDDVLSSLGEKFCSSQEDQHDAYGRNIAFKLRTLTFKQRIFAEKLINDVIYEAELQNLNRNHHISELQLFNNQ